MRSSNQSRKGWLKDTSFIVHRKELLESPAWQARSRPLAKILERLEIEECRHAGKENGNLAVSYKQFVAYGVSKKAIHPALILGTALGLLKVIQHTEWIGSVRDNNTYRLTYLPAKGRNAPSDEWANVTQEQATAAAERCTQDGNDVRFEVDAEAA